MNELMDNSQTMSSREIAELTGKRHDHVRRDIKNMLGKLEKDVREFETQYADRQGRWQIEYRLPAEHALCLIAGYDTKSRMLIMSRMRDIDQVLESIKDFEVPDDLPDMYVYAIRESETGRIKIGISRDPEQRLKQLQTGNSQTLVLVAYQKAENRYQDESRAHKDNQGHHVRGEWFTSRAQITKSGAPGMRS